MGKNLFLIKILLTAETYPVLIFAVLSVKWSRTGGSKQKFQTFSSKSDRGRLREMLAYKRFPI